MNSFPFELYGYEDSESGYSTEISRIPFPSEEDVADFDRWVDAQVRLKMNELLLKALNEDGHTPQTLAAVLGKREMLTLLCEGDFQWSYGPLSVSRINLEGFEKPIDTRRYSRPIRRPVYRYFILFEPPISSRVILSSAIEWLCIQGNVEMFSIPSVESAIEMIWRRIGLPRVVHSLITTVIITVLLTIILSTSPASKDINT